MDGPTSGTVGLLYAGLTNPVALPEVVKRQAVDEFVDVRDVAEAHVRCLEADNVAGEQIDVVGGLFSWEDARESQLDGQQD